MIDELKTRPSEERLLRIREVADRLSLRPRAAYRLLSTGALPSVRLNQRSLRVDPEDLQRFIDDRRTGNTLEATVR